MKKSIYSFIMLMLAASLAFGPVAMVRAEGNAYGHDKQEKREKKFERRGGVYQRGSSAHLMGPIFWGGQNYNDIDALIERLQKMLDAMRAARNGSSSSSSDVDVITRSATAIDEDSATMRGELDLNGDDEAQVWFQYGKNANSLTGKTTATTLDDDDGDSVAFEANVTGLSEDTTYYYRAVAKDENGRTDYGVKMSFVTDEDGSNSSNDDTDPEVTSSAARNIDEESAELRGEVDMNDFQNGVVFFVFGEDESAVEDVADDFDTFDDVDENGDDLRKVRVDTDLDDFDTYTTEIDGLDANTEHFYALAVAYEDEDGDDRIKLSSVRSFTTD